MLSFSSGYLAFTGETTHIVVVFFRDGVSWSGGEVRLGGSN